MKQVSKYFLTPDIDDQDYPTAVNQLNGFTLKFTNTNLENQYKLQLKKQLLPPFRISLLILILIHIVNFINYRFVYNTGTLSWMRLGFTIQKILLLILHKKLININVYLIDILQYLNCMYSALLTVLFFDWIFLPLGFPALGALITGMGVQIHTFIYIYTCSSYLVQGFMVFSVTMLILLRYNMALLFGIWVVYPILLLVFILFRMFEQQKRIDFYRINTKTQNLQQCLNVFNQIVPSSIIILQYLKQSNPEDANQVTDFMTSLEQIKVLYKNNYTFNLGETDTEPKLIQTLHKLQSFHGKSDQLKNQIMQRESLFDLIYERLKLQSRNNVPFAFPIKDRPEYQIHSEISEYIFFKDESQITTQMENCDYYKSIFYDVKIADCIWEGKRSVILIVNDISEKYKVQHLKEIDHYKDNLLATVSHDLKTPLNGMAISLQIMRQMLNGKEHLDIRQIGEIRKFLNGFQQSQTFLQFMINDLLDYSQINKGNIRLQIKRVNLMSIFEFIEGLFQNLAEAKNIKLNVNYEKNKSIWIYNDENRIKQVLINLVGNALKFTFQGSIDVRYEILDEDLIQIQVIDTGIGIPSHVQKRLFKLYSTYNHKNTNQHGIGLGLAISKKLVGLLGPNEYIELQSTEGIGSKFSFQIYHYSPSSSPFKQDDEYKELLTAKRNVPLLRTKDINNNFSLQQQDKQLQQFREIRLLIVDDTPFNIIALECLIRKLLPSCTIDQAFNGVEALELTKQRCYDVIFMDVNMPQMDGYQATREIKRYQKNSSQKSKILIVTAYGEDKSGVVKHGADGFMEKPVTLVELKQQLNKFKLL